LKSSSDALLFPEPSTSLLNVTPAARAAALALADASYVLTL